MPTRRPIADGYLDEVFAPDHGEEATVEADDLPAPRRAARPHPRRKAEGHRQRKRVRTAFGTEGEWGEVNLALDRRQVHFLDSLVATLRAAGVHNANSQQVVRAFVDAVIDSRIDLSRIDSLEAMQHAIRSSLRTPSLLDLPQSILDTSLRVLNPLTNGLIDFVRDRTRTGRR
jgi:hypothetical protein